MKDPGHNKIERLVADRLEALLREVPHLSVSVEQPVDGSDAGPDLVARVGSSAGLRMMVVEVKANGEPRFARAAADRLYRYTSEIPGSYGVFAAPYVSPQAADICTQAGFGYVDLAGNCRLAFDEVYLRVEKPPNHDAVRRAGRALYSPKAERVLRALLNHPGRAWHLQELAAEAVVSLGQAHNVKELLADREWIEGRARDEGVRLRDFGALLDDWAAHYAQRKHRVEAFFCLRDVADIEAGIADACRAAGLSYALTGLSAAARVAPFVRYQRAEAYVAGPQDSVIAALELKRVPSGANVHILTPYDDGVLYGLREIGGIAVVSAVQNYLDLRGAGGRAGDGAAYLRERIIEPAWRAAA